MDDETNGIATGLSTCITKDGQQTVTANIPFNNFKITLLASGTLVTDAANLGQVQLGGMVYASASGTNNYIVGLTPPATSTAIGDGFTARLYFTNANTSAATATLNFDGVGARNIVNATGTILGPGVIRPGPAQVVSYNSLFYYFPAAGGEISTLDGGTQTTGFTAAVNTRYNCIFGAAGTITGPAAASTGDRIPLSLAGRFIYTFAPNGLKINTSSNSLPIPGNQSFTLTYTGVTDGWV